MKTALCTLMITFASIATFANPHTPKSTEQLRSELRNAQWLIGHISHTDAQGLHGNVFCDKSYLALAKTMYGGRLNENDKRVIAARERVRQILAELKSRK